MKEFKTNLFDNEKIILHTADITRNKNGFEIVESKFRKNVDGRYKGYGLVIFP